ncbi:caspase-13-like isoform X1 [Ursus americanus]|uniref:caspase-13-like isoform X1 n=1 Tax=Ursus arctos TaxID=9644 RepID=UPI001CF84429|nr:caspase-13-like isoform X1 [Ursus arctos]XP_045653620.1 caspase-13-like isoform X1 [Ursus americanus]XP_057172943.1 caspase-13-like isoform X1 [Ursus arctos]
MADQTLRDKRKLFVSSVNTGTLNGLLDELLEKRVLNQEEMEKVRYENATVMDKARALIDSVLRKGSQACQIFICYICDEDSFLAEKMGLSSGTPFRSQLNSDSPAATLPSPEDKHDKNPFKILETVGKELITGVLHGLLEKDVLKLEEGEKKKFYDAKPEDKPRVFLNSVRQKRREAGQALVQTFINTDKYSTSVKAFEDIVPGPPEPEESTDTLKLCPHEEFVKLYTEKAGEIYPIKERQDRTRLALIICNIEFDHLPPRNGAELDITGMKNLLEGLGYSVDVKQKLTAKDMESALRAFAARPEHESSDSTFLVLMSHGILSGICGTTFSPENPDVLPYDTVFQIFNNRNCFKLRDKPKVIIIQACRGENLGELWVSDSPAASTDSFSHQPLLLESDVVYKVHVEKDFVAFCSSTPHNVSWRHVTKGSLFIAQLIACFQKYSWCCHLVEVFQKVQQAFEKPNVKAQMPTIERMSMTKPFYLFPGN